MQVMRVLERRPVSFSKTALLTPAVGFVPVSVALWPRCDSFNPAEFADVKRTSDRRLLRSRLVPFLSLARRCIARENQGDHVLAQLVGLMSGRKYLAYLLDQGA